MGFRNLNPIKSSVQQAGGNRHPSAPDSNFFPLVLNPQTSAWADVTLKLNLLSGSYKPLTVLEPESSHWNLIFKAESHQWQRVQKERESQSRFLFAWEPHLSFCLGAQRFSFLSNRSEVPPLWSPEKQSVEIFLYGSQGEAKVFPTFTGPLRTSSSFYWSRQVLEQVCWFFDSLVKSGIWTGSGGKKSQTIVSPTTPPGSASHTKGRFASSKTLQYNLQGAVNDDLVVF